jgi:hypothetical protein
MFRHVRETVKAVDGVSLNRAASRKQIPISFTCGKKRSSGKTGANWQQPRKRCLPSVLEDTKSP